MAVFKPYNYQKYCIDRIISDNSVGLFLDCGLGKTVITLSAVSELVKRGEVNKVLIIAPKKVAESTWSQESEIWEHTKDLVVSKVLGTEKQRIKALEEDADIYTINRECVVWLVDYLKSKWCFDMVVIDESSSFKNPKAKRFRSLKKALKKIDRLVELTGTPSPNSLQDLWSQVYLLDKGERLGKSFTAFREKYFTPGLRSGYVVYQWNEKPGAYSDITNNIKDICISMKSEDYLSLPELMYDKIPVALTGKAYKNYKDMEREMLLELSDAEISAFSAGALVGKLLQLANGAVYDDTGEWHLLHDCKIEALEELVERLQDQNVLIFYHFQHDKERIMERFDYAVAMDTDQQIVDWNNGKIKMLLAHPSSAGYGLNLQKGGNHVVWFGLTWNYEEYLQANKRLHRQGQKKPVFIHHIVSMNTVDEDVMDALQKKKLGQDAVIDALKARISVVKKGK